MDVISFLRFVIFFLRFRRHGYFTDAIGFLRFVVFFLRLHCHRYFTDAIGFSPALRFQEIFLDGSAEHCKFCIKTGRNGKFNSNKIGG